MNKTEIFKFKAFDKKHHHYFCLGSVSKNFEKGKIIENSFNGTMYDFLTDYCLIGKENIHTTRKYIMRKLNIKQF